ncbi:hypothetical protein [Yoonia sp. SS1-5]|uniref:Uncharacterized protein n=1 Tax=Yoonia rhodophyticola TaxID=3137370 RepID=A0AAN0MFI7_9RHOB
MAGAKLMALDAETVIDLAPAGQFGLIDRYLPDPYRRALNNDGDALASLTRTMRGTLRRAGAEIEAVQRSRALAFFNDLTDGRLLGALHDQAPWPEDDVPTFRDRLTRVAGLAMRGAATSDRLLNLAAIACGAAPLTRTSGANLILPETDFSFVITRQGPDNTTETTSFMGTTGEAQTRRYFEKAASGRVFPIDVYDAPMRLHQQDITPLPGPEYQFVIDNPASENLGGLDGTDPIRWPDPIFTITAGAQPFGPFAFVNIHQAQVVIVNRRLAPGATLEVSIRDMAWSHAEAGSTTIDDFTCFGTKEALYAGFALSANDHIIPSGGPEAAIGPLMSVRRAENLTFTGAEADEAPDMGDFAEASPLALPSFLGEGRTQWRLLSIAPNAPSDVEIHNAQFAAVPSDADITLSARWFGRRPGEFAVDLPPNALAPNSDGPLTHREIWLDAMIERFKLGGTVRIARDQLFSPMADFVGALELDLASGTTPADIFELDNALVFEDTLAPRDSVSILPTISFDGISALVPTDEIEVIDAQINTDVLVSIGRPGDAMTLTEGLPPAFRSNVVPTDSVSILPRLEFDGTSAAIPADEVDLDPTTVAPDALISTVQPTDIVTVTVGLPPILSSGVTPTDSVSILPRLEFEATSNAGPQDGVDIVDTTLRPDDLTSGTAPSDAIELRAGLPPALTSAVVPTDSIVVDPGAVPQREPVVFRFGSAVVPTDTVGVDPGARPQPAQPVRFAFRSNLRTGDEVSIDPGRRPTPIDPRIPIPGPGPIFDPVRPVVDVRPGRGGILRGGGNETPQQPIRLRLQSGVTPDDQIRVRRRRNRT